MRTRTDHTRRRLVRRATLGLVAVALVATLAACDVPAAPAGKLFDAWKTDHPSAATGAITTYSAKVQMFSEPYSASAQWVFITCDGAAGSLYCSWVNKVEGTLLLQVQNQTQKVINVSRIPLGNAPAGRVFHAWRVNSSSFAATYSGPGVVSTLFGKAYKSSVHWLPDGCEGAAGSTYCTWRSDANKSVILQVDNATQKVTHVGGTFFP